MRVLGEIIVILFFAAVVMQITLVRYIRPEIKRRHMERLERENRELDDQLEQLRRKRGEG